MMTIVTPRLRLREFTDADFAWVHRICRDPEVSQYSAWGPNTVEDTWAFLAEAAHTPGATSFDWAVELADGRGIGNAAVIDIDLEQRCASLGYLIDPAHAGHGYATEVAVALLSYGFDALAMTRMQATCRPENLASARVLEKAGMRLEARLTNHVVVRGELRDSLLFAAG